MQFLTKVCLGETPTLTVSGAYNPYSALWKDTDEKLAQLLQACSLDACPEHLRLLPPWPPMVMGTLSSWAEPLEIQLKLSGVSTSLVEKHPVLQWCCATSAGTAGHKWSRESFKQGQPGRAATSTSLLLASARAPKTPTPCVGSITSSTQCWPMVSSKRSHPPGTSRKSKSASVEITSKVFVLTQITSFFCKRISQTFVWLQLFTFEVAKPCLASLCTCWRASSTTGGSFGK